MLTNIQDFSLHDGAGLRTTVFFKGCNLRCYWCHNPETQKSTPEISLDSRLCIGCGACTEVCPAAADGRTAVFTTACTHCGACAQVCYAGAYKRIGYELSPAALFQRIARDADVYRVSGGGVTFSGGEPLLQPGFLCDILTLCAQAGIHTAIETALHVDESVIKPLLPLIGTWFCDVKTMDPDSHRAATGAPNERILANIRAISAAGAHMIIRTPLIPGFNDSDADRAAIEGFVASLPNKHLHEWLPLHRECAGKYTILGRIFDITG